MMRTGLPIASALARHFASHALSAVRSPPSMVKRLTLCEPGSITPSFHFALLSSKATHTVAYSAAAGVSVRLSLDILILEVGLTGRSEPTLLTTRHPT